MKNSILHSVGMAVVLCSASSFATVFTAPASSNHPPRPWPTATNLPAGKAAMTAVAAGPAEKTLARVVAVNPARTNASDIPGRRPTIGARAIQPAPGGASANLGLAKVRFAANALADRPLAITLPDGRTMSGRASYLTWNNAALGQRTVLGIAQERLGLLCPPDVVLYSNAFSGVRADLRLRCSAMGLEQDIVWREAPQLPEGWRAEDARLEVWTEWFDPPQPKREPQIVNLRESLANAAPVLATDERLNFAA